MHFKKTGVAMLSEFELFEAYRKLKIRQKMALDIGVIKNYRSHTKWINEIVAEAKKRKCYDALIEYVYNYNRVESLKKWRCP